MVVTMVPEANATADALIAEHGEQHHSVFTLRDAAEAGFSRGQRARRIRARRWAQPYPGVFRLAGAAFEWPAQLLAACLASGTRGRASHRSAAELYGLPGATRDLVEITCPRWNRNQCAEPALPLKVHESLAFDPDDTGKITAIPVTSIDITLLDLGAVVRPIVVEQALDVALRRELTTLRAVRATLERLGKRGRDGTASLRAILDERAPIAGSTESPAETAMIRMLRRNGLPAPVLQYVVVERAVFLGRVDAAYPDHKVAIEYESYEHHTGKRALERDSARRNAFAAAGWTYIAVTAVDLRDGTAVCASIRAALRRVA